MKTTDAVVFLISHDLVKSYHFISGRNMFSGFDIRIGSKYLLTNLDNGSILFLLKTPKHLLLLVFSNGIKSKHLQLMS